MAFSNGYNGDTVSLDYILETLQAENCLIPGVTENPQISVDAMGETAYIYTSPAATITTGKLGAKLSETSQGVTKVSIDLSEGYKVFDVIPGVNWQTVTADVVTNRQVKNAIAIRNKHSDEAVTYMLAHCTTFTDTTTPTASNIYDLIVGDVAEFETNLAAQKLKATGIIVGPAGIALLRKNPNFLRSTVAGDDTVQKGAVGMIAGLPVVYCQSMTTANWIILNALGFGSPMNVKNAQSFDATPAGYVNGVGIAMEVGRGFYAESTLIYKH